MQGNPELKLIYEPLINYSDKDWESPKYCLKLIGGNKEWWEKAHCPQVTDVVIIK